MIDVDSLDQLLKVNPEEFARLTLIGNFDENEWINYAPPYLVFFYGREELHACKQKSCCPERDGLSNEILSNLMVASRGADAACHIGPLYALIQCPKCCTKEVHTALEAMIVHDLYATGSVSRNMATLMECKACSSIGVLASSDYDDQRDYFLHCNKFNPVETGTGLPKGRSILHRLLGLYVVP